MSQKQQKIRALFHLSAVALGAVAVLLPGYLASSGFVFGFSQAGLLSAWILVLGIGYFARTGRIGRVSDILCIAFTSLSITLLGLEIAFRAIKFDFAREEKVTLAYPPFYREATVPSGEVFFRRDGPEEWSGQPIRRLLELHGLQYNPYKDEPTITVKYNQQGFRQEEGYTDWDLAIAGDSFTEMGILPYPQVPTTIVGKLLNLRVVNLGVVVTGPLTHLHYLRSFGVAPSTRRTVIVFFEGNDLSDLDKESTRLREFWKTGRRPYRNFRRQTSMLKAVMRMGRMPDRKQPADQIIANFRSSTGEIPISLDYLPPMSKDLPATTMSQLEFFFKEYAEFAHSNGVEAWLAYMPCKIRVMHGQIRFLDSAPDSHTQWQPTDLPETIGEFSRRYGIRFINLTSTMVQASRQGQALLFNPFYDTHINAAGAQIVAEGIARRLSEGR